MGNKVTAINNDSSGIYEGGDITQIDAEELKGNLVAIRQLINSHNLEAVKNKHKDIEIQGLKAENEYLKTAPYIAIIAAIINIIGSLIIGLATEMMGNELQQSNGDISKISVLLASVGLLLILTGSVATIFYPKARTWFNKEKSK